MAEEGLKIKIGADATGVTETFTKVATSVKQTTESLGKVQRSGADAGNALMNLSRIAQDAPYGFMGIANNINPMLESFQRLQKETGSTSSALSAMVSGLTGPAGIGLAVGVVSSLLVAFGGNLFNSGNEAEQAAKKIDAYKNSLEALSDVTEAMNSRITGVTGVEAARQKALGNDGAAFRASQKALVNQRDNLNKELKNVYLAQERLEKEHLSVSAEYNAGLDRIYELRKQIQELNNKIQENVYNHIAETNRKHEQEQERAKNALEAANRKAEAEYKRHLAELEKAAERAAKLRNDVQGAVSGGGTDPILQFLKEQNKFASLTQLQGNGPRITPNIPEDTLKNIQKQYGDLANLLNNTLTPAFEAMFDAINSGQNAFEALGKAIVRSIEQLIAQLAAMAAVAGILSLITGGAAGGGLSFMSAFNAFSGFKIPGHATGGITNGAHVAMVGEAGPEAIIPLDRLPSLIGQISGNSGSGYIAETRISGSDLVLLLSRANKSLNRQF